MWVRAVFLFVGYWPFQELWMSHRSVIWTHGPSDCFLSLSLRALSGYNSWFGRRPGHFLSLAFYLGAANMKNSMKTSLGCVPLITITKAKGPSRANLLLRRRLCQRRESAENGKELMPGGQKHRKRKQTNSSPTLRAKRRKAEREEIEPLWWLPGLAGWRRINAPTEWKWAAKVTLGSICCDTCCATNILLTNKVMGKTLVSLC